MNEEKLNEYCRIFKGENATEDIYILHGFASNIDKQRDIGKEFAKENPNYNIIQCNARGHGNRLKTNKLDWKGTVDDLEEIINNRERNVILIGHSMGGTMALTIGINNKNVKKVFAISAIHDGEEMIKKSIGNIDKSPIINKEKLKKKFDKVFSALPDKFEKCELINDKKFYLIHAKLDTVVPFKEFEKNKEKLCIRDENTLIFDKFVPVLDKIIFSDHLMPFYDEKTKKFIQDKMNE